MVLVYLRHGDDNDPEASHRHDAHITRKGGKEVKSVIKKIIKKTKTLPSIIRCSPFRRAVETLEKVEAYIRKKHGDDEWDKIRIVYDRRLSRHFSTREQQSPDVSTKTKDLVKGKIPIFETWKKFQGRVEKHVGRMMKKDYYSHKTPMVWCLTHTLVMKHACVVLKTPLVSWLSFLEWVIVKDPNREEEKRQESKRSERKNEKDK